MNPDIIEKIARSENPWRTLAEGVRLNKISAEELRILSAELLNQEKYNGTVRTGVRVGDELPESGVR